MLDAHGRLPDTNSAMSIGRAAADFLVEAIERLEPADGAPRSARIPYMVLKTCFVEGRKLYQAANQLGMSTRQLTRERARAIHILLTELEDGLEPVAEVPHGHYLPEPIPSILVFMPRPAQTQKLRSALETHRLVHVHGPPGIGKTALVADLAHRASEDSAVLWHRFRSGVNDSLGSFLFELGQHLREQERDELSTYLTQALPNPDLAFATRLALQALADAQHLIVVDDYQTVDDDSSIAGLLDEASSRLPQLRVITISRHRTLASEAGASFEVAPLSRLEVQTLLEQLSVTVEPRLADSLHRWTQGICQLVKLAAAWLKTTTPDEVAEGIESLEANEDVQAFLLDTITELIGPEDRAILSAASVFRDRFTDDALAFVAQRTRGEVQDASMRLVRSYLATRGRGGDVAFFHNSVRDYVYVRVDPELRAELHGRAAQWYHRQHQPREAEYHERAAIEAEEELTEPT